MQAWKMNPSGVLGCHGSRKQIYLTPPPYLAVQLSPIMHCGQYRHLVVILASAPPRSPQLQEELV